MAEAILNMRGTGSFSSSERPTNFREKILREYPDGPAPFLMILGMLKSESVDDPKFTNFEQVIPDQVHALHATPTSQSSESEADGGTTHRLLRLATTDYTNPDYYFKIGHVIKNETTGELCLVRGKEGTNGLLVTRNIGVSATYGDNSGTVGTGITMTAGDLITIIGSSHEEGADTPTAIHYQPSEVWNFIQTFRTALSMTDDAAQTYYRTGKIADNLKFDAAMAHSMEMEKAMFNGKRERVTGAIDSQPQRFMGGLDFFLSSNVSSFSSGLTRTGFLDFLRPIYTVPGGSQNKVAFCGATALGIMTQYAEDLGQIFLEPKDKTYGLQIRTLVHAWGELKLVNHPLFSEHATWTKNMYIVDTRNVLYRYLKGRDTRFLRERQGNGEDRVTHEFMTKCSLEVRHERTHGIATAIDTFVG
jgi:hypothetical protein